MHMNHTLISKGETLCERCNSILASSAAKNSHNKNQIKHKTLVDESHWRYVNDRENELVSSSNDDRNGIEQILTSGAITYDGHDENDKILEASPRKNSVSMLRKQFENISDKRTICNVDRQIISGKFFKSASSPLKLSVESVGTGNEEPTVDSYYFVELSKVLVATNNAHENTE
ncbi:hypothetical protein Bhyg_07958, partial [Pseudolycoriella hygida]